MQYAPKLKKAMEEMKKIMENYDIAGSVVLHTPGHGEFYLNISPSYSCAWFEGDHFRMKAKKTDFPDIKTWEKAIKDTTNMMSVLAEIQAGMALNMAQLSKQIDKIVNADHDDGEFTSHTTQNN